MKVYLWVGTKDFLEKWIVLESRKLDDALEAATAAANEGNVFGLYEAVDQMIVCHDRIGAMQFIIKSSSEL